MRRNRKLLLCRAMISMSGLWIASSNAEAATVTWNNAGGGNWSGPNWTGGVGTNPPQPADTARFALASSYTVTLDVNPTVFTTILVGSDLTIANSTPGRTYTNTSTMAVNTGSTFNLTAATPIAWNVNNNCSFNANVTINNGNDFTQSGGGQTIGTAGASVTTVSGAGTTFTCAGLSVANVTSSTGSLIVSSGAGASLGNGISNVANASSAIGSITVQSGSSLTSNELRLASDTTFAGTASLTVTGVGTTMLQGGSGPIQVGGPIGTATATFSDLSVTTLNFGMTVGALGTTNIQSGATINSASDVAINSAPAGGGDMVITGAGSGFTQSGALADLTVGGASGGTATLSLVSSGAYTTGTGAGAVVVGTTGVIDIASGTFNLNGGATINGTLQRSSSGTLTWANGKTMTVQNGGDVAITGALSLPSSATVNVTGAGSTFNTTSTLTIPASSSVAVSNSGALTVGSLAGAGGISSSTTIFTGSDNLSTSFSGAISGAGALSKSGTGTQTLAGASSYGGGTTVAFGGVRLEHNTAAGTGAIILTNSSSHVVVSGGISTANALTIAGGGLGGTIGTSPGTDGALHGASGTNTWTGTITLDGTGSNITQPTLNEISADGTLILSGVIQDGLGAHWGKSKLGDVVLSGASPNTYTGITRTWHGRLIIEKDGALGAAGSTTTADGNTFMLNSTTATGTSTIAFRAPASSPAGFSYNTDEWLNTGGNATTGTGAQLDNLGGNNTFAGKIGLGGFLNVGFIQSSIGVTAGSLELSDSIYASGSAPFDPRQITKSGAGTLIISGNSSAAPTNTVNNGSLVNSKFTIPAGTVEMRGLLPGVTTYDVNGGTLHVNTAQAFTPATVTARTGGQVTFSDGNVHIAALDVQAAGSASITQGAGLAVEVDTITVANTFNLRDNKLIVNTTPAGSWNGSAYTGVLGMVQGGRGDGTWNGIGIRTSMTDATTGILTTLAVARADETGHDGGTFGGVSVAGSDVLVMYTWGGDADLNGELNGDDYFYLDSNINSNNPSFHNGDFDYNGELNGDDYFILDSNILQAQASAPFPTGAGVGGGGLAAVPEPGGLLGVAIAATGLARRRRRGARG